MGVYCSPFAPTFNVPLGTRTPPPHAEPPAAESVTSELAEAVSIIALLKRPFLKFSTHVVCFPIADCVYISARVNVPMLIPSETIKMMFLASFFNSESANVAFSSAENSKGDIANPAAVKEEFRKKSRRFIIGSLEVKLGFLMGFRKENV